MFASTRPNQLTALRRPQVLLPKFLQHDLWERRGNVPALTLLLQAYLARAAPAVVARGYLPPLLGIFQKLLAVPRTAPDAYALLAALLAHVPLADLQPYVGQVFVLLFKVLTGPRKSTRNTVAFLGTLARFAAWHGPEPAAAAMEAAAAGAAVQVLGQVAPRNVGHVAGREDRRAVAIGFARFLAEWPPLLQARTAAGCAALQMLISGACMYARDIAPGRWQCSTHLPAPGRCAYDAVCGTSSHTLPVLTQATATPLNASQHTSLQMQQREQWVALLDAVLDWLKRGAASEAADAVDNSALAASLEELAEYGSEFNKLSNVAILPPAVCPQVRHWSRLVNSVWLVVLSGHSHIVPTFCVLAGH